MFWLNPLMGQAPRALGGAEGHRGRDVGAMEARSPGGLAAAATRDDELRQRVQAVAQTPGKQERDRKMTGWPKLKELRFVRVRVSRSTRIEK